jgi:hypothetical protein
MTCHTYTTVSFEPSDALVKLAQSLAAIFAIEFEPRNRHERRAAKKRGRRR